MGVNFSNLSFSDVNRFMNPPTYSTNSFGGGGTNGARIAGPEALSVSGQLTAARKSLDHLEMAWSA